MNLANTIVVGMDGSEPARIAAQWAATWAGERDLTLVLLAAHGTIGAERRSTEAAWHWPDAAERKQQVEIVLDKAVAELREHHPDLTIETAIVTADPVAALLRASREAALVVIGTRRLGGLTGKLFGSVADPTIARAEGPIAVVPPAYTFEPGPIVLGFDLSEPPMAAARFAFDAAALSGRSLTVATVEDPARPLELIAAADPAVQGIGGDVDARERQVRRVLAELIMEYAEVALEIVIVPGGTANALLEAGAHATLLVVGTRGRSDLRGLLFGSISRAVLRQTTSPAVVVPEPGH